MAKFNDLLNKKPKTYVSMILDKSASMGNCKDFAVTTYNEQLAVLREMSQEQDISVSLVEFSQNVDFKVLNESVETVRDMDPNNYVLESSTALNDAIGFTVNKLLAQDDINEEHVSVLLLVITDGYENASKEYSTKNIAQQIKDLKKTNRWTFTYLGASTDPEEMKTSAMRNYGLSVGDTFCMPSFQSDFEGVDYSNIGTSAVARGTRSFLSSRENGATSTQDFYSTENKVANNVIVVDNVEKKVVDTKK